MSTRRDLAAAARTLERVAFEISVLESYCYPVFDGGIPIAAARSYARASDLLDRNAEELERIRRRMRR